MPIDIKPDNILVTNSPKGTLYKLSDLGDASSPEVPSNDGAHLIGAELFCAPEVPLGIPWTTKADIWGLGATVSYLTSSPNMRPSKKKKQSYYLRVLFVQGITLISGHYAFLPRNPPPPDDPQLSLAVLQIQNDFYGPISREALNGLADDSIQPLLQQFEEKHQAFPLSAMSRNISKEDVDFFRSVMKIDPRQRPTAGEILGCSWFDGV